MHHIINAYTDLAFWPLLEMCYVAAILKEHAAFILSGMSIVTLAGGCGDWITTGIRTSCRHK